MSDRSYRVLVGQPRVVVTDTLRVGRADTIFSLFILFMIRGHTTPVWLHLLEGADRELRKSRDATHLATDGPVPRHYDGHTTAARVRVAVFVRSEYSNALVGDGVLQPAPRSANLNSAFGGMQLFATEAWRAAPLLLHTVTHSAQLTQPTCAAATAVTAMGSPSLAPSHLCCGLDLLV